MKFKCTNCKKIVNIDLRTKWARYNLTRGGNLSIGCGKIRQIKGRIYLKRIKK